MEITAAVLRAADGPYALDRLIETFPLSAINDAEHSSLSGGVIKPVLLP